MKKKFLIVTTVPMSLFFFKGQVGKLKSKFNIEVVSSPDEGLQKFCSKENVKGHPIRMSREISILNDVKSLFKLFQLFKRIKPDVVHGNTPKGGNLSMIAGWLTGVPVRIYCIHGLRYQGASGFKRKLLKFMERVSCRFATQVMTVSFGVKDLIKQENITSKEVCVIWNGSVNGIDTDHFSPNKVNSSNLKEEFGIKPTDIVFGFVGRLVKDKGVNELIESFVHINKNYPNTKLLLVGDFEAADPILVGTKKEIETNSNIIFGGWQQDIRPFLKIMNIFTFPSYREGFGISLMEAAAMNVPAISSNITGCNEIIKDGYNGKLVQSKSVIELQKAMKFLLDNPNVVSGMAAVSRQYVFDRYDQKQLWNKIVLAYDKMINHV